MRYVYVIKEREGKLCSLWDYPFIHGIIPFFITLYRISFTDPRSSPSKRAFTYVASEEDGALALKASRTIAISANPENYRHEDAL